MFPGPTELRLIGYSIESIWTQKIQIKYIDTKNQLADMLTKGNFTRRMESSSVFVQYKPFQFYTFSDAMAKRLQQDSGEERVTAKSGPMMNLIARVPRICHPQRQKARGREAAEIKILGVRKLRERG